MALNARRAAKQLFISTLEPAADAPTTSPQANTRPSRSTTTPSSSCRAQLRERGKALLEQLHGDGAAPELINDMVGLCPDFVDMSIEWALGGVMARPGLDLVTRELVVSGSCVTLGLLCGWGIGSQCARPLQGRPACSANRRSVDQCVTRVSRN
jgi:hypothetical protein